MTELLYLQCPMCLQFSIREHPMSRIDVKFSQMVKCNFCGYAANVEKHRKNIEKKWGKNEK